MKPDAAHLRETYLGPVTANSPAHPAGGARHWTLGVANWKQVNILRGSEISKRPSPVILTVARAAKTNFTLLFQLFHRQIGDLVAPAAGVYLAQSRIVRITSLKHLCLRHSPNTASLLEPVTYVANIHPVIS
jgi:hypothetical protein